MAAIIPFLMMNETAERFRRRKARKEKEKLCVPAKPWVPAIGIDLGTTYSCVGYWNTIHNRVEIIANDQGNRMTPSYVCFNAIESMIGDAAFYQVASNPTNTIFDAKRLIGRKFSDELVQNDIKLWPFKVIPGEDDKPMIVVSFKGEEKQFTAEEISSMVLMKMKQTAEAYIGSEVKDAVVTVPAYFSNSQRQSTINAASIAGINVLGIIGEPAAAAIAYGLDHYLNTTGTRNVLIFDLGGGTFDVSIVTIKNGKIEVKATSGDTHLGGEDFDNNMVNYYIEEFKRNHHKDISGNPKAIRRLRTACERAKRILSSSVSTLIDIDCLFESIDLSANVSRAKFEELNLNLFKKCMEIVENCLTDAKINKNALDDVVLVGGSSRIPKVQQMLRQLLNGKKLCQSINPDEAIAHGAAIQAASLTNQLDNKTLDLVEVTPLSIGVETYIDTMSVVIPRNTKIPTKIVQSFSTARDNLSSIQIRIFEGERARSTDNYYLGEMVFDGLKIAPRRVASVEVCFDLQANGILNVYARDTVTSKEQSMSIIRGKLSDDDIKKMTKEANKYKVKDEAHKKKQEAMYDFGNYVWGLRNNIKNNNMYSTQKKAAEDAIEEAIKWFDTNLKYFEVHEYEAKKEELMARLKEMEQQPSLLRRLIILLATSCDP